MPQNNHPFMRYLWEIVNLEFMMKFFVFYFFLVWFCMILWVLQDISERSGNYIYRSIAFLLITIGTPLWIILYLLIRPRKASEKKLLREIEENLWILHNIVSEKIWENTSHIDTQSCPHCQEKIKEEYIICPSCQTALRNNCISCEKEIKSNWSVCPYCMNTQNKQATKNTD